MLRLTNSFSRYLTVTCERVDYKAHVKKYSHLSCVREICKGSCIDLKLKRQFNYYVILQKHNSSKKKTKIKIPPLNLDELNKTEQMSRRLPEPSHACYGGTFVVSSDDDSSTEDWCVQTYAGQGGSTPMIPPNFRSWECVNYSGVDYPFTFKVVSYNVLAQCLLESHPNLYTECFFRDLKWKVRSARLYDEIVTLAPDILCLQEVQNSHMRSFYSKFEKIGFGGVFKQKTGEREDGCAIYYKKSVFELVDKASVEFHQPNLPLLNRDNIGVMVKLMPHHGSNRPIVVATTHLLYNPRRNDVRLAQIQVFLAEIDRFAFYNNGTESGHLPIILTGDFNSTPDTEVIKLLNNGHVSTENARDNSDWEQIGVTDSCQHLSVYLNRRQGQNTDYSELQIYNSDYCERRPAPVPPAEGRAPGPFKLLFNSGDLWQHLQLTSVYDKHGLGGSSEATTFQDHWVTVDYIYFSRCSNLRLTNRLRLPTANECKVLKHLPNDVFASDHLALAAVFEISLDRDNAHS